LLDVATGSHCDLGDPLEVLQIGREDDIDILGAPHHSPSANCQSTHYDELGACGCEPVQQLVESRLVQLLRAAPLKRISL